MLKEDLNKIKSVAKMLYDIVPLEYIKGNLSLPIIAHPFTTNAYAIVDNEFVNIVEDEESAKKFRDQIFQLIDESNNISHILALMNKSYYMLYIKLLLMNNVSQKVIDKNLLDFWITQEFPNRDVNVKPKEIVEWFKKADKKLLMNSSELKEYEKLTSSNKITLYRGVCLEGSWRGLSWTTSLDKAKWFANRFKGNSRVYKVEVTNPKNILCYIDRRNELEVILDIEKVKDDIKEVA